MKKKLSILLAFAMLVTSLTACGGSGASGAKEYYINDVSVSNPDYTGDMPSGETLAEDDVRLANAHSYEEIAPYVYEYTVTMDNWQEYFAVEVEYDADKNYTINLKLKEGYGIKADINVDFTFNSVAIQDGVESSNRSVNKTAFVYAGGSKFTIDQTLNCNTSNYYEARNVVCTNISENVVVYKLSLPSSMWVEHDGKTAFYVFSEEEGDFIALYEYENDSYDIAHLLGEDVIHQYASVFGTGEIETPVVDATPEGDASGTTPDAGSSEQTPAPEPAPSNGFEGIYWVTNMAYGVEGQREGFYLDGNGKYVKLNADGSIEERQYSGVEVSSSSRGTSYLFYIYLNGESLGALEYTFGQDGNLYYEWGDGWEGGLDPYFPVSEAEFYGN